MGLGRRIAAGGVAVLVGLTGCGGSDDDAASDRTTTSAPAGSATTSTLLPPGGESPRSISVSLEQWASDWTEVNGTAAATNNSQGTTIDPSVFKTAEGPDGHDVFAGRLDGSVLMGGLLDSDGYLMMLVQGADPDGASTAAASLTTLTLLSAEDDSLELAQAYRDVALNPVSGSQRYIASDAYDFVIRGQDGANAGDGLVLIFVSSVTDEVTATARADIVQPLVFKLMV